MYSRTMAPPILTSHSPNQRHEFQYPRDCPFIYSFLYPHTYTYATAYIGERERKNASARLIHRPRPLANSPRFPELIIKVCCILCVATYIQRKRILSGHRANSSERVYVCTSRAVNKIVAARETVRRNNRRRVAEISRACVCTEG